MNHFNGNPGFYDPGFHPSTSTGGMPGFLPSNAGDGQLSCDQTFVYWGDDQMGPLTNAFYPENAYPPHQPSIHSSQAETFQRQLYPYRNSVDRHVNAEESLVQCTGFLTQERSTNTEEGRIIAIAEGEPRQSRLPNGQGRPRKYRARLKELTRKLTEWAQKQKGLDKPPMFNDVLALALEHISTIRPVLYQEPHIAVGSNKGRESVSSRNRKAREMRDAERVLYEHLSKHYRRGEKRWERAQLLTRVLEDLGIEIENIV